MRLPRVSLATIGFVILIFAVDFGLIRWGITSDWDASGTLLDFLPMVDVLLVFLYLSRRGKASKIAYRTGFLIAGTAATALLIAAMIAAPNVVCAPLSAVERPFGKAVIALATRIFGNAAMKSIALQLPLIILFEWILPMLYLNVPPLLIGFAGARFLRRRAGEARGVGPRALQTT